KIIIKLNSADKFPKMFEKEADGLKRLAKTKSFKIPAVLSYGNFSNYSYLILEWIAEKEKTKDFWINFADNLAKLHQHSAPTFGLSIDNYIGSLPQYNQSEIQNAAEFYIEKRLIPQFELATKNGFTFQNLSNFYQNLSNIIPNEKPALIHGD